MSIGDESLAAMQKKPDGECRFPTDYWSGLGFSKSMPQSAIAEKLNQFNHLRYEGPSVPAQYEVRRMWIIVNYRSRCFRKNCD